MEKKNDRVERIEVMGCNVETGEKKLISIPAGMARLMKYTSFGMITLEDGTYTVEL